MNIAVDAGAIVVTRLREEIAARPHHQLARA